MELRKGRRDCRRNCCPHFSRSGLWLHHLDGNTVSWAYEFWRGRESRPEISLGYTKFLISNGNANMDIPIQKRYTTQMQGWEYKFWCMLTTDPTNAVGMARSPRRGMPKWHRAEFISHCIECSGPASSMLQGWSMCYRVFRSRSDLWPTRFQKHFVSQIDNQSISRCF